MKSRTIARIGIVLIVVATILTAFNIVFGTETAPVKSIPVGTPVSNPSLTSAVTNVLGVVEYICWGAAVILLIMLGIKYMASAPDAKAEVKKMAVYYIVGAVAVFAAAAVLRIIRSVTNSTLTTHQQ